MVGPAPRCARSSNWRIHKFSPCACHSAGKHQVTTNAQNECTLTAHTARKSLLDKTAPTSTLSMAKPTLSKLLGELAPPIFKWCQWPSALQERIGRTVLLRRCQSGLPKQALPKSTGTSRPRHKGRKAVESSPQDVVQSAIESETAVSNRGAPKCLQAYTSCGVSR